MQPATYVPSKFCSVTPRHGDTVRYLGVDVEDALTLAEGIEV